MPCHRGIFFLRMKSYKSILLLAMLAFPVLIYLFLQGFGRNEFDIPVYHAEGVDGQPGGCGGAESDMFGVPHWVDDDTLVLVGKSAVVYAIMPDDSIDLVTIKNNLQSFFSRYGDDQRVRWYELRGPRQRLIHYARCALRLDVTHDTLTNTLFGNQLVLVDDQRRIRGYYDPLDAKELDRLSVELQILITQQNEK